MKDYVEKLLKDYNKMKQELELLEFELSNCEPITDDEILEGLILSGVSENPIGKSGIILIHHKTS